MAIFELTALELLTLGSGIGLIVALAVLVVGSDLTTSAKAGTAIILTLLPWPILRGIFGSVTTTLISFTGLGIAILTFLLAEPLTDREIPRPVLAALVFLTAIAGHAILNQPGPAEGNEDFLPQLIVFWIAAIIAAWALADTPLAENDTVIKGIVLIAVVTAVLTALARDELDQSHIELGRMASFGLLVMLLHTPKGWVPPARWSAIAVLAIGSIASGSRAPIIFLAFSAIFVSLVKYTMRADIVSLVRITLGMVMSIVLMLLTLPSIVRGLRGDSNEASALFIYRQLDLLSVTALLESQSAADRTDSLFAPAIDLMQTNPLFGAGLTMGVTPQTGIYNYAHNFVLELGAGMGYPGLILGIIIMVLAGINIAGLAQRGSTLIAGAALYWLLGAQISSNLPINRFAFLFVLLAFVEFGQRFNPAEHEAAEELETAEELEAEGSDEASDDSDDPENERSDESSGASSDAEPVGAFLGALG